MEAYVIAVIKNESGIVKGYRLLDIESNSCKDVTKDQLISTLKLNKDFKLENVKLSGGKLQGIYASINDFPIIGCDNNMRLIITEQLKSKCTVLKILINEYNGKLHGILVANAIGKTKTYKESQINELIRNKVAYISKTEKGVNIYAKREKIKVELKKRNIKLNNSSYKVTDEEALDINDIWNFFKFRQYMVERGYKFELYTHRGEKIDYLIERDSDIENTLMDFQNELRFYIRNIDDKCKVVHLPTGIVCIDDLFEKTGSIVEKDTIIFPNTVTRIENVFMHSTKDIWLRTNRFLFQTNINTELFQTDLMMSGVNYIEVLKEWNLPIGTVRNYTIINVHNIYENSILSGKNISSDESKITLVDSFCNSEINSDIALKGIVGIKGSFANTIINGELRFSDKLVYIEKSFSNRPGFANRFFDQLIMNSRSLESIEDSFRSYNSNGNTVTLDFGNCPKINSIKNSFKNIENKLIIQIENCELLESIKGSFENSGVSEIVLGCKTKEFSYYDNITYKFNDNYSTYIYNGMYYTYTTKIDKLVLDKRFTKVRADGLRYMNVNSIDPDNNIESLGYKAFEFCRATNFDTGWISKVTNIPDSCFKSSNLENVIIRENIEYIGESAFEDCKSLIKIVVSDKTKVAKNILKPPYGSNRVLTAYCVKGSPFEKEAKLRKYINVISFKTFEEALEAFKGLESSEKNIQKFKFMASLGDIDTELTQEPYIRYAPEIYKIKRIMEEDFSEYVDYVPLKSFVNNGPSIYDYNIFEKLRIVFENIKNIKTDNTNKFIDDSLDCNKVSKKFKYRCLLINMIATNRLDEIFCEENENQIKNMAHTLGIKVVHLDINCGIFILKTRLANDYMDYYTIVKDNRVVWMAPFESNTYTNISIRNFEGLIMETVDYEEDTKINGLTSYIRAGDQYKKGDLFDVDKTSIRLGGMTLPDNSNYLNLMLDILRHNLLIIGGGYKAGVTGKYNSKRDTQVDTLVFLDLNNQNIIIAQCLLKDRDYIRSDYSTKAYGMKFVLGTLDVIKVMSIQEATKDKVFVEYMRNLSLYFSDEELINTFKIEVFPDNKKKIIRNSEDAYDKEAGLKKDEILTDLIDMIHVDTDYKSDSQLSDVIVRAILNTDLVCKLDISYKQLKSKYDLLDEGYTYDLNGGFGTKLECYDVYLNGLRGSYDWKAYVYHNNKNKKEIFLSCLPMHLLINKIAKLKRPLVSTEIHQLVNLYDIKNGYYTNNIDYEIFTTSTISTKYFNNSIAVHLVVQRQSLETFLVLDLKGFRPIFRFKTLADGMRFLDKSINKNWHKLRLYLENIARFWMDVDDYIDSSNDFETLRTHILKGLANGEPVGYSTHKLSRYLAKQPYIES